MVYCTLLKIRGRTTTSKVDYFQELRKFLETTNFGSSVPPIIIGAPIIRLI